MKSSNLLYGLFLILLFAACKKDDEVNLVPEISLVEVTPSNVVSFGDSIILRFSYYDGNGDLGYDNPDSNSIWVHDRRLTDADQYYLHPLAPLDANVSIQGVIKLKINNLFLLGSGGSETTQLTIRLRDRAGNWSNELVIPEITITQ